MRGSLKENEISSLIESMIYQLSSFKQMPQAERSITHVRRLQEKLVELESAFLVQRRSGST